MQYKNTCTSDQEATKTVLFRIGDIDANVEPDSGASANIVDEYQFRALHHRSMEITELNRAKIP